MMAAADEPRPQPARANDGWIDLMKPGVWKKYDPAWIVTDEVKLDPEKNTRLKATKTENGTAWLNGEKGRCRTSLPRSHSVTARSTSSS